MKIEWPSEHRFLAKHLLISQFLDLGITIFSLHFHKFSNQSQVFQSQILGGGSDSVSVLFDRFALSAIEFDGMQFYQNIYSYQPNFAFIPGFPLIIQSVQSFVSFFHENLYRKHLTTIFLAVILNKLLFFLCAQKMLKICHRLTGNHSKSQAIMLTFIYNPCTIFFNSIYSEATYCFLIFTAIQALLQGAENEKESSRKCLVKGQEIKAVLLFFLAGTIRTNSIFLSPIIGLPIIKHLYSSIIDKNIFESLKLLIKGCIFLILIIAPFILYLKHMQRQLCSSEMDLENSVQLQQQCQKHMPNLYGYIQKQFWSVGLFSYFKLFNVLFIFIGLPSILIVLLGIFRQRNLISDLLSKFLTIRDPKSQEKDSIVLGMYFSFLILYSVTVALTNIQSGTRFFSTHPIFYVLLQQCSHYRIVRVFVLTYFIVGVHLFTVGFPWT